MTIARRLMSEREELKTAIAKAYEENIGKCYQYRNIEDDVFFYHLTGVESHKMYKGTIVKLGGITGVTDNDYVSAYLILELATEIDKESFDKAFDKALELLRK